MAVTKQGPNFFLFNILQKEGLTKWELHPLSLKAFSNEFCCGNCEGKTAQEALLCGLKSKGQKIIHFSYTCDDALKQRGERHQDRNKRITYLFF